MPHKKYIHQPTVINDFAILIGVNLIFLIVFIQFDILEWAYHFSRQHEGLELDEWIPLGLTITLSLLVFSYRRIKELGQMAETLEKMSLLDFLTGLANRRAGQISLLSWCERAEQSQQAFVVYQINIDKFSKVNELYGQLIGDEVIKNVGQRLKAKIPVAAQLFRWLDDNFIIVIPLNKVDTPNDFAYKIQQSINNKVMQSTLSLSCSIAYAVWRKGQTANDILYEVEDALMDVKQRNKQIIESNHKDALTAI
jgi:diguanylate cyclase (GGDEF)-like protein